MLAPAPNPKPTAHEKALLTLQNKQSRRKAKSGQLPLPSLNIPLEAYTSFTTHLHSSTRILALLGAGLSAASGIPTFRGPGGLWREHNATDLARSEAFYKNPSLVWQFYNERRRAALAAKPNRGHVALAELARVKGGFLAVSQNIDGLSERAGHESGKLVAVHGSLHEVRCSGRVCGGRGCSGEECKGRGCCLKECEFRREIMEGMLEGAEPDFALERIPVCPVCGALLRPAIVWFGEPIPEESRERVHDWLDEVEKVDLMLVVGTSAVVFPAAAYIHAARVQGARVAVFNVEEPSKEDQENPVTRLRDEDWFFKGNAAEVLPEVLKEIVGVVKSYD